MRALVFAAVLAAMGSGGGAALASHACGPWSGDEVRCIGNNGISHEQPGGIVSRDYTMTLLPQSPHSSARMFVDVWISTCGFPGVHLGSNALVTFADKSNPAQFKAHAGHYQCVEWFVHDCESPRGAYKSCDQVVHATIEDK